jgi:predicted nucleic acid-binding Zn ribbon protein
VGEQGGRKPEPLADQVRRAREALGAARAQAAAKGLRPAAPRRSGPGPAAPGPPRPREPLEPEQAGFEGAGPGSGEPPDAGLAAPERPAADRPAGDRPAGDWPAGDWPAGDWPAGDQPEGDSSQARESLAPSRSRREPQRRVRRDDPQPLGLAIGGLLDSQGWNLAAATGSVFGRWAQIVGPELADHTQPESLRDGELVVVADSTAWATQLRLLSAQLVKRLNAELGTGAVQRVKVRGPVTATRKPGEWRVRGGRGPRDTYG